MLRSYFLLLIAFIALPFILLTIPVFLFLGRSPKTIAIGVDQLGGSVIYGKENLTVSSYTHYLCTTKSRLCLFEKVINFLFGKDHCGKSFHWEVEADKKEYNDLERAYKRHRLLFNKQ